MFSGRIAELQSVIHNRNHVRIYRVTPKTHHSINFHNDANQSSAAQGSTTTPISCNETPETANINTKSKYGPLNPIDNIEEQHATNTVTVNFFKIVDIFLLNTQGLVTNKKNKCSFIKEVTSSNTESKIIAITETWGKKHFDGEYLKAFKGYNLIRTDRDTSNAALDEDCLSKNGGVLLLTSKDIPQKPVLKFSNGNCELVIAELLTINTAAIVFYRPSGKNFSLPKYTEALKHVRDYLQTNNDRKESMEILLMGDFNFTQDEVKWVSSTEGLIPNYNEGVTPEKQGFFPHYSPLLKIFLSIKLWTKLPMVTTHLTSFSQPPQIHCPTVKHK